MGNKEEVNKLMYELQNCINSSYMWREIGDDEEVTKLTNRIIEIRQEVLNIVID